MKLRLTRSSNRRRPRMAADAALLAGLFLAAAGPSAADTRREASQKTIEVRGFTALDVENNRGRIEVVAGPAGRVKISALKTIRALGDESADELSARTLVETEVRSGRLAVRVRYPQRRAIHVNLWEGFNTDEFPRSDVKLTIEVPAGFPVSLRSSSGDQATEGLKGSQSLSASSGDVTVVRSGGRVDVHTVSGDVVIDGAAASVRIATTSGDVDVPSASDSLDVETTSGDIAIDKAPGGVVVHSTSGEVRVLGAARRVRIGTVSGEIHAGLLSPLFLAKLTTASGDVVAELDEGLGCTIDMRTGSGSIELDVPARTRNVSRRAVTALVGDGAAPIEVQSASGDITITGRSR